MSARFWSGLMVVAALTANDGVNDGWRDVAESLLETPEDSLCLCETSGILSGETMDAIRKARPRYVAFVMRPQEVCETTIRGIKRMMCDVDEDPFEDALWGIVTGPTAADAKRVALCSEPREITSVLATTGVGEDLVKGPITVISDANSSGEWWTKDAAGDIVRSSADGDISNVFADAWDRQDPDLLLTSSHASERNLEMPFSRGNIVSVGDSFAAVENVRMIDYSTGQAIEDVSLPDDSSVRQLSAPRREKVWLAAGNCLIANHKQKGSDMIMTALGFGKVNQFVGYIKTTWFGEIGWNTWRYFGGYGLPLNESWYAANQLLIKRLFGGETIDAAELAGRIWDFDGTVFYGNPRRRIAIPCRTRLAASKEGDLPLLVIFDSAVPNRRLVSAPEGFEVFVADDFALVMKWPELSPDWRKDLVFE